MNQELELLERQYQLTNDPLILAKYAYKYLLVTGQPPPIPIPEVSFFCHTHQQFCGHSPYTYVSFNCPKTIWVPSAPDPFGHYVPYNAPCQIEPKIANLDNWINWMGHPHNLFQIKKNEFPEPTTSDKLISRFVEWHQDHPGFLLLQDQILSYLTHQFSIALEVIANLQVLPQVLPEIKGAYLLTRESGNVITWQELVELTNLRTDLITDYCPQETRYIRRAYLDFCLENYSPTTILYYNLVAPAVGSKNFRETNVRGGITLGSPVATSNEVISVTMSWFG